MTKRSNFKRRKNDAYDTPVKAMTPLLPYLPKKCRFIEPCAGNGQMVDYFVEQGHECVDYFDLEPRRDDIKEFDAFDYSVANYYDCDFIITNPPWTRQLLHPMIELWASVRPTWVLFDSDWIFTKQAIPYLEYCHKIVSIGRVSWMDNGVSGKDNSAWFLFDKTTTRVTDGPVIYGTK